MAFPQAIRNNGAKKNKIPPPPQKKKPLPDTNTKTIYETQKTGNTVFPPEVHVSTEHRTSPSHPDIQNKGIWGVVSMHGGYPKALESQNVLRSRQLKIQNLKLFRWC